jgi:hypothetical protein
MEKLTFLNIFLLLIVVILISNILFPFSNLTSAAINNFDNSEPKCSFYNNGELFPLSQNRCCNQILKQYQCEEINDEIICYNSLSSQKHFTLNKKMFYQCQKEGYDVKLE